MLFYSVVHKVIAPVTAVFLLTACGSGSHSETPTPTETITVSIGGSTAVRGALCGADIEVTKLDGSALFLAKSYIYDPQRDGTEYNATATKLLPFGERIAGRFSATRTFAVSSLPSEETMMLLKVSGGNEIDPDGDGFVVPGEIRNFAGPLYAYATFGALRDGNVSVNLFSSAAAAVAAERHLSVPSTVTMILGKVAQKLFSSDPAGSMIDAATLTRFNPSIVENNTSVHFSYLNDPGSYKALAEGNYGGGLYEGNRALWKLDTDHEGLMDAFEQLSGTDTALADSDSDGVNDYAEVWSGTDPLNGGSVEGDLLFPYQWYLLNTGQTGGAQNGGIAGEDLDIVGLPTTFTGSGDVVVGIVDTGVESGHPDLKNNLDVSLSYHYGTHSNDPVPLASDIGYHGTSCAGIIGAQGFNVRGVRGVAPMTRLAGFNVLATGRVSHFADAFLRPGIDIFSNSWGAMTSAALTDWGPVLEGALEEGAVNGRDGKGAIYVFAAGNDRTASHEGYANTSSLHNSKYAITVSSVNADGTLSSYSNTGANVLVAGTGGEYGLTDPAIVTTDLTGLGIGHDIKYDNDEIVLGDSLLDGNNPDGNYTRFMNGTSSACPAVAGVCALVLQANPALTRRDVRYILARSARQNDASDGSWSLNGAGLPINDKYGFGIVDAAAAVAMAEGFSSLGQEQTSALYTDSANVDIPDANSSGIERTLNVSESMTVEHVDIWITTEHYRIDDLRIVVVSPLGTESVLAVGGENYIRGVERYADWRFSTVRCLDEPAQGTWRLKVMDLRSGYIGSLSSWGIQISGH
ncbi:S8 family serine peptidase [Sulfurimonas sp. HSL1-6]|uniref:S8 family serine peptidase n=1 Tax=Thiomicrolovo immobilis TaxID=3131935 RepID=UPI0031F722C8